MKNKRDKIRERMKKKIMVRRKQKRGSLEGKKKNHVYSVEKENQKKNDEEEE